MAQELTLFAGQHTDAGTVSVFDDGEDLRIALETNAAWRVSKVHTYAGLTSGELSAAHPAPGRFPYKSTYDELVPIHMTVVPLVELGATCGSVVKIAVHADLVANDDRQETGWAEGPFEFWRAWGWWFEYEVCCPEEDEEHAEGDDTQSRPSASEEADGRFLVRFDRSPGSDEIAAIEAEGARIRWRYDLIPAIAAVVAPEQLDDVMNAVRGHTGVRDVEPDVVIEVMATAVTPSDPLFVHQWGLHNWGYAGGIPDTDIDAPAAWGVTTGSPEVVVGVVDSGVDVGHVDLVDNLWTNADEIPGNGIDDDGNGRVDDIHGWNFVGDDASLLDGDDDIHGTHVAGTIAAATDNGIGTAGVAWDARVMVLRAIGNDGRGWASDAIAAIGYATAHGVPILSAAWGSARRAAALRDAVHASGALVVAASGNDGADADVAPVYPAAEDLENVVSVTALDRNDQLVCFANVGRNSVDLGAPGAEILGPVPGDGYARIWGTSAAAAYVAGAAALVLDRYPEMGSEALKRAILETVDPVPALMGRTVTSGRLNAFWAVGCEEECHADAHCDDGVYCNGIELCVDGVCIGGEPVVCPDAAGEGPCFASVCDEASRGCGLVAADDETPCSDGDACNGLERCRGGQCGPGFAPLCVVGNPCAVGLCDPRLGCVAEPLPDGTLCSDGAWCNGEEACRGGECQEGSPPSCDDGDPCTVDACDEPGCTHVTAADGASCGDGDPCNGAETCLAGVCTPGAALDCDDGNVCTAHSCVPGEGCVFDDVANGTPCGVGDTCDGGEVCIGGECGFVAPLDCDDNNPCTADTCDPLVGCQNANRSDGAACDDVDPCNGREMCLAGACAVTVPTDCDDNNPCTADACDPDAGGCVHTNVGAGVVCAPADACHEAATCVVGTCVPADETDCDDDDPCTIDSCDPFGCRHDPAADGSACNDGNHCNGEETCQAGQCVAGLELVCDDGNACSDDLCATSVGCIHPAVCGQPFSLPPQTVEQTGGASEDTSPPEPLAEHDVADPVVVPTEGPDHAWTCDFEDLAGGTVLDAQVVLEIEREVGATGTVHVEVMCGPDVLATSSVDLEQVVELAAGWEGEGIIPTQIVVPIPDAQENLSLLNCAEATIWVEGETGYEVYWSYAGLEGQVDALPPQACTVDADCGDGIVCNGDESCVDGLCAAGVPVDCAGLSDACNLGICYEALASCVRVPLPGEGCDPAYCGDSILQAARGETCDLGANNADDAECTGTCQTASCGDGLVWAGIEACDDGNADDTDACLVTCTTAACGDGALYVGVEACDDGNPDDTDACVDGCQLAVCGDGHVRAWIEECDDGNAEDSDGCLSTCVAARCGDGIVRVGVEECDDGNLVDGDGCTAECEAGPVRLNRIGAGREHTCGGVAGSRLYCWGSGALGQLGRGDTLSIGDDEPASAAMAIDLGAAVIDLAVGGWHSCAVLDDGAMRCWGRGVHGALGHGNEETIGDDELAAIQPPVQVGGAVVQAAAGDAHTCAVLDTGGVRCWGLGTFGRLGYGDELSVGDDETPADQGDIDLGGVAQQVAAGREHTCALLEGGAVRCWGRGSHGQLGYGNTLTIGDDEPPSVAGDVPLGAAAIQIATGDHHTCAVLSHGGLRCWGHRLSGRLGYPGTSNIGDDETPAAVGDVDLGAVAVRVAAGLDHTCALLESGGVRCFGSGALGQLGYGNTANVGDNQVPAAVGVVDVGGQVSDLCASAHTCARLWGGGLRCWGAATAGKLGYGNLSSIGDDETPATAGDVPLP